MQWRKLPIESIVWSFRIPTYLHKIRTCTCSPINSSSCSHIKQTLFSVLFCFRIALHQQKEMNVFCMSVFLKENVCRMFYLILLINLMEIFNNFFGISLIPDLNINYKWLINLLEVNLKTQVDTNIPEEKQENQWGKNYIKHYLWQSNFHLYMWKCITMEVNYHYYHSPFILVSLVRKRLYNSTKIQAEKWGREPISLWIPACLFLTQPTMKWQEKI